MPAIAVSDLLVVQGRYLEMLPELQNFAALRHRHLPMEQREDAICECLAWSWQWCLSAFARGILHELNPRVLSYYAMKMWRPGRRFAPTSASDVLSPAAQVSGRVTVSSLEADKGDDPGNPATLGMALVDSSRLPPDEIARCDIDYRVALRRPSVSRKSRRLFGHLVRDNNLGHARRIAKEMRISPPRICQLKGKLRDALESIGYGYPVVASATAQLAIGTRAWPGNNVAKSTHMFESVEPRAGGVRVHAIVDGEKTTRDISRREALHRVKAAMVLAEVNPDPAFRKNLLGQAQKLMEAADISRRLEGLPGYASHHFRESTRLTRQEPEIVRYPKPQRLSVSA